MPSLADSRELQRLLIEHAPAALAMFDREMHYLAVGHRWLTDYGVDGQHIIGRSHYEVLPEIGETWRAVYRRGIAGEVIRAEKDRFERSDGRVKWLHWEVRPWYGTDGCIGGIILCSEDITELVEAEQALRDSEALFRAMFEQAAVGVAQIDTISGRFIRVNQTYGDIIGYSREEPQQLDFQTVTHPDDLARNLANMGLLRSEELDPFTIEMRYYSKSGATVWVNLTVSPMWSKGENPRSHMAIVQDITERKQAEERLKESAAKFVGMFTHAALSMVLARFPSGVIEEVNEAFENAFGCARAEAVGRTALDLGLHSDPEERDRVIAELFAQGRVRDRVLQLQTGSSGRRWFSSSIDVFEIGREKYLLSTAVGITDRTRAEQVLAGRARQQAMVADLGQLALVGGDLQTLYNRAVERVAETLGVEYCKVLELLPDRSALLLRAGVGWREGLVRRAVVGIGPDSQAGCTLQSKEAVVVEDLRTEKRFIGPPLLHEHDVVSGLSVIIGEVEKPFGVLGAHTNRRQPFSAEDAVFLQSDANVLAEAIERMRAPLRAISGFSKALMEDYGNALEGEARIYLEFLHLVSDDQQTVELAAGWSGAMEPCRAGHDRRDPVREAGVWVEDALRQRQPVVFNDFAPCRNTPGRPEGNAPLQRLPSVPVIEQGKVAMLCGVGNKASQRTDLEVETVQLDELRAWQQVMRNREDPGARTKARGERSAGSTGQAAARRRRSGARGRSMRDRWWLFVCGGNIGNADGQRAGTGDWGGAVECEPGGAAAGASGARGETDEGN